MRGYALAAVTLVVCALLPAAALYYAWGNVLAPGVRNDFGQAYYQAAEAVLDGEEIYPGDDFGFTAGVVLEYVYPPLTAIVLTPFTLLSVEPAMALFSLLLMATVVATLFVLGVRDWRCFGLAFLSQPVTESIQIGNVTVVLALAAALVWRFRDRPRAGGASLGVALATKLLLWPVLVWSLATRRLRLAAWAAGAGAVVVLASWSVIGFKQIWEYPGVLQRLGELMDGRSYTVYALGLDLGLPDAVARVSWMLLGVGVLASVVLVARRGDERRAFILAIAAVLACSPIVWIHYFTLLLVVVALAEPTLGPIWFVGLGMQLVVSTGVENGSTFQTAAVLLLAALTVALALRPRLTMSFGRPSRVTPAAESP